MSRPSPRIALLYAAFCAGVFALGFAAAEIAVRAQGGVPWRPLPIAMRVDPGGRLYRADPELGYRLVPGSLSVRYPTGYVFHATHDEDGLRATRPSPLAGQTDGESGPERPGLWIFGCSFSYGWGVDDAEAWPWRLQQSLPRWDVTNFSVNGYGTLHSWLQLERALDERPPPEIVVLAYAGFHVDRNTFVRERRKRVAPYSSLGPLVQPYARVVDGALRVEMADVEYRPWPGMRSSALIHRAEQRWNQLERERADGPAVTRAIVRAFVERARGVGARVVVAGIAGDTAEVRREAAELGAIAVDMAIDLSAHGMTNPPPDAHPSPAAHRRYAARLLRALAAAGIR